MHATILLAALAASGGPVDYYPATYHQLPDCSWQAAATPRGGYHRRVYYGHYQRPPYDYRTVFDHPWNDGPSRLHWPIQPPTVSYPPPLLSEPGPVRIVPSADPVDWAAQASTPRRDIHYGDAPSSQAARRVVRDIDNPLRH